MAYSLNNSKIASLIQEQSPWMHTGRVPDSVVPVTERPLAQYFWAYLLQHPLKRYFVILGPRRVGKTTVMYHTVKYLLKNNILASKIIWVRLDHPEFIHFNLGDIVKTAVQLSQAEEKNPLFLFLDELVYAKHWDRWLKTFYDEHWPVKIIASSSASAALKEKKQESGIGRWEEIYLAPYLFSEYLQLLKGLGISELSAEWLKVLSNTQGLIRERLFETINYLHKMNFSNLNAEAQRLRLLSIGGFPELLSYYEYVFFRTKLYRKWMKLSHTPDLKDQLKKHVRQTIKDLQRSSFLKAQQTLRSDAIERAIYKDLTQSYNIDNPIALEQFLYLLAGQIGGILSNQTAKDIQGISQSTMHRYLNYLIQTYMVFTLPNYAGAEAKIQTRGRKVYFIDSAVRNSALQKSETDIFGNPEELGKLQENILASHLYTLGQKAGHRLYYWRRGKYEVDFIYYDPSNPLAFEIGSRGKHSRSGLRKLIEHYPQFRGKCYYVAPKVGFVPPDMHPDGIGQLSLDFLLLTIGLQHEHILKQRFGRDPQKEAAKI